MLKSTQYAAIVSLVGLIALCLAWELWLAPLQPGGSWLVLKALPLLLPLRGFVHARRYTFQWMSLMIWLYFTEGVVRATSDAGLSATLAWIETALSVTLFVASATYAKFSEPSRMTMR
ncbi:MAG TPA: DUF2069 domain-containing protein [Rhodocyclaceae bacterium]|nr:DUF2069 domain-containing protein [Rhodocyclaceae bacterium]